MTDPQGRPRWEQLLAPRALLLGCVLSFLACCLLGHRVGRRNLFAGFERFHAFINPSTLFYPTVREVRTLGRERLPKEKVAVVVGGNSIMYGVGQGAEALWTRALQAELGDDYRVLNLALTGAAPGEFGGVAAEVLAWDRPRLLFVASVSSAGVPGEPDGRPFRYLFWEARARGLLVPDAEREAGLAKWARLRPDPTLDEVKAGAWVDRWVFSRDLWTAVSYRRLSTVWCPLVADRFWRARRSYPDPAAAPLGPAPPNYPAADNGPALQIVRAFAARGPDFGPDGLPAELRACFPAPCRRRTLLLALPDSPYYVEQLTPAERDNYRATLRQAAAGLERAGFCSLEAGRGYTRADFADRCHLSEAGGRKLAAEVAPKLRQMAHDLGYLKGEAR